MIYFCLGQINLHSHHVSRRDMQLPHWFGSFLVCCKMSRTEVCKFYRRRGHISVCCADCRSIQECTYPWRLVTRASKFRMVVRNILWAVSSDVPSCHVASRVLRSRLDFGEICAPPPSRPYIYHDCSSHFSNL